jgi:signal transduction histidine kinase
VTSLRRALTGLAVLGVCLIGLAIFLATETTHGGDAPVTNAIFVSAIMGSYMGIGLYAWWRRPHNRVGPLMTAVGFSGFLSALQLSNTSLLFTIGIVFGGGLPFVLAVHMALAFPDGRLHSRLERVLIGGTYFVAIATPLLIAMFSRTCDCDDRFDHPDSAFLVTESPDAVRTIEAVAGASGVAATLVMAWILIRRFRAATPAGRKGLAPVLFVGAVLLILLALTLGFDVLGSGDDAEEGIDGIMQIAFALLPWAFLGGLLRSRQWRAGAITEVMATLSESPGQDRLRDALREALADPTLRLAYWAPSASGYVDADGRRVTLPGDDDPQRAATLVERDGRPIAALVHDRALCREPELVRTVGGAAALALENERLDAELRARVAELHDSRQRLLEAGLAERRRLERDLHDGAQQRLVALSLQLGLVRSKLDEDPEAAKELLDGAREEARCALEDLRELARGIHPAVLTDRGLGPALESLAERAPLPVEVAGVPDERLPGAVEAAAYFVVAESLTNVAKYAQATHAEVSVSRENGFALVEVRDDGVGGADPRGGTGLRGMADRLAALDGRLEIESEPGRGTSVRARVPVPVPVR